MKGLYAYIRVSTTKQGEGVSLQEQRAAISAYAERRHLTISRWFEEKVTAAKKGRPGFEQMLKGLRKKDAAGVIIHKIDRSARNLRDWAALGDLIDAGVQVHFANESLDLLSRGGRLAADIQAIVAADFIRNNRDEAKKGLYGRLKQGIYPFQAPIGYLDRGGGNVKELDPRRAPLVKKAFELYASGGYTLDSLESELYRLGLRNSRGRRVSRTRLSMVLNNIFYTGLIRIRRNGQVFVGRHTPIISERLFKTVQGRLQGKIKHTVRVHDFTLRSIFRCGDCDRFLVGEMQKGIAYYRCHGKGCRSRCFREDRLEKALFDCWPPFAPHERWAKTLKGKLTQILAEESKETSDTTHNAQLQIDSIQARLARLVDALVDGLISKEVYEERRTSLLHEQQALQTNRTAQAPTKDVIASFVLKAFELANTAQQSYLLADKAQKRQLIRELCSNCTVRGNEVFVEPYFPLATLTKRASSFLVHPIGTDVEPKLSTQKANKIIRWAEDKLTRLTIDQQEERDELIDRTMQQLRESTATEHL